MKTSSGFRIELTCRYEEWWRYNVEMMCAAFDAADERIGFAAVRSQIAEAGAELRERPAGVDVPTRLSLESGACDHAQLYLYVIPHTLPRDNRIGAAAPFDLTLRIALDGRALRTERIRVNQWGGTSLRLELAEGMKNQK